LVALWPRFFHDDGPPPRPPDAIVARRRVVQRDLFLVAADGDAIVGAVLAGWDGHRGWLYRLAVDPMHRRRGVGKALVADAEARLAALGCPKLNLQVESENRDVVAFYERLGFAVEARISLGKRLPPRPA
jgi:ribosomal protein S18 acetylase RimI-like enzyme